MNSKCSDETTEIWRHAIPSHTKFPAQVCIARRWAILDRYFSTRGGMPKTIPWAADNEDWGVAKEVEFEYYGLN